ncbi:MAG TPA: hypothetical protein VGU73_03870 [Acidimicrobiia bacterium]|nr:hypothetical protein [Acidimicrobiia bacterium]
MREGDGSVAPTAAPTQHWLYPMVAGGPGHFEGSDRRYRADFEVYRRAAMAGRVLRGEGPLAAGFRSIREDDVLWLFAGDDAGVVGRATVREVFGRPEPRVRFALDRPTSRILAQDPLPGALVRRSLPRAHHGPVSLVEHAGLTQGLEWWVELLDDRDQRRLEPLGVPTLRRVIGRRASLLSDPSVAGLVRTLRAFDFAVGVHAESTSSSFLVGLGEGRLVVGCLVRGGQSAQPTPAVLRTIAAVGWRVWSLKEQAASTSLETSQWFAFSRVPHPQLVRFLEEGDHSVSWSQGGHVELGPRTRLRWGAPASRHRAATKARPQVVKFDTMATEEPAAVPESVSFRRRVTD